MQFTIYGDSISGNCLKVKFTADHLGLRYDWREVNILAGESRTPEYLAINPQGQVPAIRMADGRCLAQSNAIIRYLARSSDLLPDDAYCQAQIDEWLFWEQYSHEPYVAVCRFQMRYAGLDISEREAWRVERGEAALDFLETHLTSRDWLVGNALSIADIALLAYTRVAHEGGFDLQAREQVRGWIARCEAQLKL